MLANPDFAERLYAIMLYLVTARGNQFISANISSAVFRQLPEGFMDFLLNAKRNTYAGGTGKRAPVLDGSVQLEFSDSIFLYRDIYFGSAYFIGQEVVYYMGAPVWSLSYSGGLTGPSTDSGSIYTFLKEALLRPDPQFPVRGPSRYQSRGMAYENIVNGDIWRFHGTEQIMLDDKVVYDLHYGGGLVRQ